MSRQARARVADGEKRGSNEQDSSRLWFISWMQVSFKLSKERTNGIRNGGLENRIESCGMVSNNESEEKKKRGNKKTEENDKFTDITQTRRQTRKEETSGCQKAQWSRDQRLPTARSANTCNQKTHKRRGNDAKGRIERNSWERKTRGKATYRKVHARWGKRNQQQCEKEKRSELSQLVFKLRESHIAIKHCLLRTCSSDNRSYNGVIRIKKRLRSKSPEAKTRSRSSNKWQNTTGMLAKETAKKSRYCHPLRMNTAAEREGLFRTDTK